MKFLNKLKSDRQDLINNLNDNIVSLEEIAYKQQLEIEQWKEEANKYQNLWCEAVKDLQTAKTEAIKEFAERLKNGMCVDRDYNDLITTKKYIKKVAKEMVGDE